MIHGVGSKLNDEKMKNPIQKTIDEIMKRCPDIKLEVVELFTKVKYHARVRSINEQKVIDKIDNRKRKAGVLKENPKKIKTMRDFVKDGHFNV